MQELLFFVFKCFYLMLPAYFANMAPVFARKVNFLNYPLDFSKTLNGKPIFGSNKTFRGLFFGTLMAILIAFLQFRLYNMDFFKSASFADYNNWLLIGFLIGFGSLTGDFVKSFFKRRAGVKPGERFLPFDQTDFVLGALIFAMPAIKITWSIFFTTILLSFVLHILAVHIGFYLKIRNEKW